VTGLLKLKKLPPENISAIRQNNISREEESQLKGKSLGSKKAQLMKEGKYGALTDKRGRAGLKSRVEAPKVHNDADLDEYYE
jgi:hypothetical protein